MTTWYELIKDAKQNGDYIFIGFYIFAAPVLLPFEILGRMAAVVLFGWEG